MRATGARDLGIVPRGDLTGFNWANVPAILVETGFLSNPRENRLLHTDAYRRKVAAGLVAGVESFVAALGRAAVARLVEQHLDAARQQHRRPDAPAEVPRILPEADPPGRAAPRPSRRCRRRSARAVVRVAGLGRVHAELPRRQVEDQPAVARVIGVPAEDVAEDARSASASGV